MERVEIANEGECLLIKGPANIEIKEGKVMILGGTFGAGECIVIPKGKAISLRAYTPVVLKVTSGCVERVIEDVPPYWWKAVEELDSVEKPVITLVIGGVDMGKTTFTTFLANAAFIKGLKVAVVDADVGQSDVGPPCFVAMGLLSHPVTDMAKVKLEDAYFIGSTTPSTYPHRIVAGVKLMVEKALKLGCEAVFIDTPGWITGLKARDLNIALFNVLRPNMVIALQEKNEAEGILKALSGSKTRILRLPALAACKRDRETRKFLREAAYRRHLRGSENVTLDLSKVSVAYTALFSGDKLDVEEERKISAVLGFNPVYAESSPDVLTIVLPSEKNVKRESIEALKILFKGKEIHLVNENEFENLLVALLNEDDKYLGIGILKKLDYAAKKVTVFTPVPPEKVTKILFGSVKVIENGVEIGPIRHN